MVVAVRPRRSPAHVRITPSSPEVHSLSDAGDRRTGLAARSSGTFASERAVSPRLILKSEAQPSGRGAQVSGQQHPDGHRIVAGVDGSASSLEALRWAVWQADLTGSTVDAV